MNRNSKIIRQFKAKPVSFIVISVSSFVVGQVIESAFGQPIQNYFKTIWSNDFFVKNCVPFIIGIILPIAAIILMSYILFNPDDRTEDLTKQDGASGDLTGVTNLNKSDRELLSVLKSVGIVGATTNLSATQFEPREVMDRTNRHLLFMGILGSKWVNSHGAAFEYFLRRVEQKHGEVKFLLIDPKGQAYNKLEILREGAIKEESLDKLYAFSKKYRCLNVKLYDELPSFRLIFIDEETLAVSRYKLDREGHFNSKFGWEAPHVIITTNADWSLFYSFEKFFHTIWGKSKELEEHMSNKSSN
jgi:hypothetical protein